MPAIAVLTLPSVVFTQRNGVQLAAFLPAPVNPPTQARGRQGRGAGLRHYEIEQASPDVGTHVEPERWHLVNVFNADAMLMPLTFDTLEQALAYVGRMPGTLRIVEVTDEGERVPVDRNSL